MICVTPMDQNAPQFVFDKYIKYKFKTNEYFNKTYKTY